MVGYAGHGNLRVSYSESDKGFQSVELNCCQSELAVDVGPGFVENAQRRDAISHSLWWTLPVPPQ